MKLLKIFAISLVVGSSSLTANPEWQKAEDAFSAYASGYELGEDALFSSVELSEFSGSADEALQDELEPEYDAYLDNVPLRSFEPKTREELLQSLGEAYRDGKDPYAKEYTKKDPLVRFVELKYRDDRHWMIDNFRMTQLVARKGEVGSDGEEVKTHQVEIRWTSALIDMSKLKGATWVMTTFNTKVGPIKMQTGHAQLFFEFEPGGVVTPFGEANSIVNSYEGYRDAGTVFNPLLGMMDKYDSIFVMGSFSDVTLKALKVFNGVDLYDLKLSAEEASKILLNSLALATDREELARRKYHTTRNSCVTNQVRLINSGVGADRRIKEWHTLFGKRVMRTLGSIFPSQIPKTLKKSGLMLAETHYTGRDRILELYDKTVQNQPFRAPAQVRIFSALYSE
ncbi:MAG: DUF4105 domain-containing protein [Candidatus Cloacimonetes bacterium]|nr:DUF4105 domain-containing protein [Candidatus Cloacimonadota bacterium]